MTLAYRIIRSEHYEIDLVMRCLHNLSAALYRETWKPDFDLLFLLLDYAESFPAADRGFQRLPQSGLRPDARRALR